MSLQNDYNRWLKRGRQRSAVAQVLRKPMTATEICSAARSINPHLQLRDVWFLMNQFAERSLVVCLNPQQITARLYCFTEQGRKAVLSAFGLAALIPPRGINWQKYSCVVRARIRRLALEELGRMEQKTGQSQTATQIRKQICSDHSVGLNVVIRAVKELLNLNLVACVGLTERRSRKLYRLTPAGTMFSFGLT